MNSTPPESVRDVLPRWVGQFVTVVWAIHHPDLHYFKDAPPWRDKLVIAERKMVTGESCVMLQGHPLCPVRVERLLPNQ